MRCEFWLVGLYAIVCALALAAIPLSAAGWIASDPLSAAPAILLGAPWSQILLRIGNSQSMAINFALLFLAMAINAGILWALSRLACRWLTRG